MVYILLTCIKIGRNCGLFRLIIKYAVNCEGALIKLSSILLILLMPLSGFTTALEDENPLKVLLTQKKRSECSDLVYNAQLLIPGLYKRNQIDSINIIIDFVDSTCSSNYFPELRTLIEVDHGLLNEDWCDQAVIESILLYHSWPTMIIHTGYFNYRRGGSLEFGFQSEEYRTFIAKLATRLAREVDTGTMAELLCLYYSGQTGQIILNLHDSVYGGYCIQSIYEARIQYLLKENFRSRGHIGILSGIWSPTGNNRVLGNKASIGFQAGIRPNRFGVDFVMQLRFLKAKEEYEVYDEGQLRKTDHFFGGLIGIDMSYELIRFKRFSLDFQTGLGWDGFDAIDQKDNSKTISSLGLSVGVKPRIFVDKQKTKYVGILVRYSKVNYYTNGGTDLSGNTISFNIVVGLLKNGYANDRLKALRYFD